MTIIPEKIRKVRCGDAVVAEMLQKVDNNELTPVWAVEFEGGHISYLVEYKGNRYRVGENPLGDSRVWVYATPLPPSEIAPDRKIEMEL